MKTLRYLLAVSLLFFMSSVFAQENHRVIILTDIEADPDDSQSLVRLLVYSNEIDIKGIVATTSCWQQDNISPQTLVNIIEAYDKVQPQLKKHDSAYPKASTLLKLVKDGLRVYGMQGVGDGKDSEGSNWIIQELEKDDQRPLWISVWGGVNTLAQALHKIRATKTAEETAALVAKLRVYTISDQDDSGIWIRNNFPELFYIVSPGDHYASATWSAVNTVVDGIDNTTISNQWLADNIQQDHGPLGAIYPDTAWGVEGDTPAYLSLIPNGLNDPERPNFGGWGGRYELYQPDFSKTQKGSSVVEIAPETRAIWTNATDTLHQYLPKEYGRTVEQSSQQFSTDKASLWRWRDDFQNDFAARMDWTINSFENANHPPIPKLAHADEITVNAGQNFRLDARLSTDPDGDNLSFLWFHYPEASSYKTLIPVNGAENVYHVNFTAPKVDKNETLHFILRVTDKGTPALSRYRRVIVNVLSQ